MAKLKTTAEYNDQMEELREQLSLLERQKEIAGGSTEFSDTNAVFCPLCGVEIKYSGKDETISELKCPECEENFWLKLKVKITYSTAIYKEALTQDDE